MIINLVLIAGLVIIALAALFSNYQDKRDIFMLIMDMQEMYHEERFDLYNRIQTSNPQIATALKKHNYGVTGSGNTRQEAELPNGIKVTLE